MKDMMVGCENLDMKSAMKKMAKMPMPKHGKEAKATKSAKGNGKHSSMAM